MKRIGLEDIVACLENLSGQVKVPEEIRVPALSAVEKMIAEGCRNSDLNG
jgi:quinolinate synthase